jgi:hypothetical protein
MGTVDGVKVAGDALTIEGLILTECEELDSSHRQVMLTDYGEYGLDVNWRIRGRYDKSSDVVEVTERLFHCAAAIIRARPDSPLSLMREAESFYVFNTADRLILSPYFKALPNLLPLFGKPFVIKEMLN